MALGAVYFDEPGEQADAAAAPVRLEQTSLAKRSFAANRSLLRLGPAADPRTTVVTADGATTITFPWVGGYVDTMGDQDWFQLDLAGLGQPPDAHWTYDVRVDLRTGAAGSAVEYVWKLYRDPNENAVVVDQPGDSNGFFAAAGDRDTAVQPLALVTPEPGTDQRLWVGDAWAGRFYLGVSDFDFVDAPLPDDDWGYDAPYFFRVTLVYHAGVSAPP